MEGDELAELTKRMMAHQPGQHYAHSEIAVMLLPRWGGAAGESAEYAQTVADEIGKADGDGLYAQIALHLLHYHKDATFFAETKFDEARVVRGLEALCVASPQDVNLYNSALRFAYVRKHPALAKQWVEGFKEPATQWSPQVWGSLSRYKLALEFARN